MQDGGMTLCWTRATRSGLLEIEVRLTDEADELLVGYAHAPGFDVHDDLQDPADIAERVREHFEKAVA